MGIPQFLSKVMVLGIVLLFSFGCAVAFTEENERLLEAGSITKISMSQADMQYSALSAASEKGRKTIDEIASIYNSIANQLTDTQKKEHELFDTFFASHFSVYLKDGKSIDLYVATSLTSNKIGIYVNDGADTVKQVTDISLVEKAAKRLIDCYANFDPKNHSFGDRRIKLGGYLHFSGNDGPEDGDVHIFVIPPKHDGSFTRQLQSKTGIVYPSKQALFVGKGSSLAETYDFKQALPPLGVAFDGTLQEIYPGEWTICLEYGPTSCTGLTILPSDGTLMMVNGDLFPKRPELNVNKGITYISARSLSSALHINIAWDSKRKRVLLDTPQLKADAVKSAGKSKSIEIWVRGKKLETDLPPLLIQGSVYVPLRSISEALGYKIEQYKRSNCIRLIGVST